MMELLRDGDILYYSIGVCIDLYNYWLMVTIWIVRIMIDTSLYNLKELMVTPGESERCK